MNIKHLRECRYKNFVVLFEIYKFENVLFTVIKYIVVTLTQIIVILFKFTENHVFCVCNQTSILHTFITLHSLTSTDTSRNEISIIVCYCAHQS